MIENFLQQAEKIVAEHRAQYKGVYYMKGSNVFSNPFKTIEDAFSGKWGHVRDDLEATASVVGNYLLPGSSLVTDQLVSNGAKDQLNSTIGKVAQIGTGAVGAGVGSGVTGLPSASSVGAGWGNAVKGLGNAASSAGNALGITDSAAGAAAPWIDPDIAAVGADASAGAASPWVDPGTVSAPTTGAASAAQISPAGAAPDIAALNAIEPGASSAGDAGGAAPDALSAGESSLLNQATNAASAPISSTELSSIAAPAAAAAGSSGGAGSSLWNSVKSALPVAGALGQLAPLISGAGVAADIAKGNETTPEQTAMKTQAEQAASQGTQLQSYLTNGTLPAGAQAGIDQAKNSAKAAIRSKYASMGMSGSSSEQQELSSVDSNAQAQGEALATQLLNSGIQESQLSSQLYQNIVNGQLQQDKDLSSAIGNFASTLGGTAASKPNSITVNV